MRVLPYWNLAPPALQPLNTFEALRIVICWLPCDGCCGLCVGPANSITAETKQAVLLRGPAACVAAWRDVGLVLSGTRAVPRNVELDLEIMDRTWCELHNMVGPFPAVTPTSFWP